MVCAPSGVLASRAVPVTAQRLRSSGDVRAVFAARAAAACPQAVVHRRRREDSGPPRVAFVAGKKVGNAVARNSVKRRLRAVVRELELPPGSDYVVVGRAAALGAPYRELLHRVSATFHKMEGLAL